MNDEQINGLITLIEAVAEMVIAEREGETSEYHRRIVRIASEEFLARSSAASDVETPQSLRPGRRLEKSRKSAANNGEK